MKKAKPYKAVSKLSDKVKKAAAQLKDMRVQLKMLKAEAKTEQDNNSPVKKAVGRKAKGKRGRPAKK